PERITEKLLAELPDKCVTTLRQQIASEALEALHFGAVLDCSPVVNRAVTEILVAKPANRVEAFECVAEGIDTSVTTSATRVRCVLLGEFPHRQGFRGFV